MMVKFDVFSIYKCKGQGHLKVKVIYQYVSMKVLSLVLFCVNMNQIHQVIEKLGQNDVEI